MIKRLILLLLIVLRVGTLSARPFCDSIIVVNKGLGGNNSNELLARLDADVLTLKPNLVVLMVGTNDFLNTKKLVSMEQYQLNLKTIATSIKESGSQLIVMSSPPVDSTFLYQRHDKSLYADVPNIMLQTVNGMVAKMALETDVFYINLFDKFQSHNIPIHNQDLFIRNEYNSGSNDGVHPTDLGYHFIAKVIHQFIVKNDELSSVRTIVCFGDSITKGVGSSKRNSYPAQLEQMLNAGVVKH